MSDQHSNDDASEKPVADLPRVTPGAPNNIFLMGIMGSGKSTVGWILSRLVGYGFIDTDVEVEKRAKKTVARIFLEDGEDAFREHERLVVKDLGDMRSHVISLGGGTVADDQSWELIQKLGVGVWLNPPVEEVARRLLSNLETFKARPLIGDLAPENEQEEKLNGKSDEKFKILCQRISALTGMRQPRYNKAKVVVENGFSTPEDSAKLVLRGLNGSGGAKPVLQLNLGLGSLIRW